MRICVQCKQFHDDPGIKCRGCLTTKRHGASTTYEWVVDCAAPHGQSQSEREWMDHVDDHIRESDWQRDGKGSE